MKKSLRNLSDDAIFSIIAGDFESSDGQSRWDDIEEETEPTQTEAIKESFADKTDAELFALISNDCESSDGQNRYKNCDRKATKKSSKPKGYLPPINKSSKPKGYLPPINKSNKENTMTKITLASGKTILVASNHAARMQKSIKELNGDTLKRVERAAKRLKNKDSFVASIKNNGGRTYNQLSSWVNTTHSTEKSAQLANDEDRIVYSV